jgi:hypothetical protein
MRYDSPGERDARCREGVTIMSERAQALAEEFEQANNEAIAAIEGCSDEQWRRHVESENRSVGVVMHHVAIAHPRIAEWVTAAPRGQDVGVDEGWVDQFNAQHAREQATCTKKEFLFNHEIDPYTGQNGSGLQQSEAFPRYELRHRVLFDPEHNELHKTEVLLVRARMSTLVGEIRKQLAGRRTNPRIQRRLAWHTAASRR